MGVVPGVVGPRLLCFRFPQAEFAPTTNSRWKPSTSVALPFADQGAVTSFWTLDEHDHNVSISTNDVIRLRYPSLTERYIYIHTTKNPNQKMR